MAPPFGSVTTCRIDPTGGTKQQSTSDNDDAPPAPKDAHFGIKRSLLSQLWEVRLYRRGVTHRRCFSAARYGDMDQALAAAQAWRDARRTAWRTVVKVATTGILVTLLLGAALKLKLMGGGQ